MYTLSSISKVLLGRQVGLTPTDLARWETKRESKYSENILSFQLNSVMKPQLIDIKYYFEKQKKNSLQNILKYL